MTQHFSLWCGTPCVNKFFDIVFIASNITYCILFGMNLAIINPIFTDIVIMDATLLPTFLVLWNNLLPLKYIVYCNGSSVVLTLVSFSASTTDLASSEVSLSGTSVGGCHAWGQYWLGFVPRSGPSLCPDLVWSHPGISRELCGFAWGTCMLLNSLTGNFGVRTPLHAQLLHVPLVG